MGLKSWIVSKDQFAERVEFKVGGAQGSQTIYGGIYYLMILVVFYTSSASIVLNFLNTSEPKVDLQTNVDGNYPTIDLVAGNHLPIFMFFANGNYIPKSKLQAYVSFKAYQLFLPDTSDGALPSYKFIDVANCSDLQDSVLKKTFVSDELGSLKKNLLHEGVCLNLTSPTLAVQGKVGDSKFNTFVIEILPCSLPEGCVSEEEIKNMLVIKTFNQPMLTASNFESPLSYYTTANDVFELNPIIKQTRRVLLSTSSVLNENGFSLQACLQSTTAQRKKWCHQWVPETRLKGTAPNLKLEKGPAPHI